MNKVKHTGARKRQLNYGRTDPKKRLSHTKKGPGRRHDKGAAK